MQVYIPKVLEQTLHLRYTGNVTGDVTFTRENVTADFVAEAAINATFLLPIAAKAEEEIQTEGPYTVRDNMLSFAGHTLVYTATKDSLHLIQLYSLNEALALLPDSFKSMVEMASDDMFTDDPIQIRMSFARTGEQLTGDFDGDGRVGVEDFLLFVDAFGSREGDPAYNEDMDLIPDGIINIPDFLVFANNFGKTIES